MQALEEHTKTHVIIALVRFKNADVFGVAVGQKYGLSIMSNDLPRCFFFVLMIVSFSSPLLDDRVMK